MVTKTKQAVQVIIAFSLCVYATVALGAERSDLLFANSLNEEIVSIRVLYATPYDEPRYSSSDVYLQPQHEYRIGVQGTTHPERIFFDLATSILDFSDISALNPDNLMQLEIKIENGVPVLLRLDDENKAMVQGVEHAILSKANQPNAVDRDSLTSAKTIEDVLELVKETADSAQEEMGTIRDFDLEAGPIWNNDHALVRCPEAVKEWNEANGGGARWTGHWATTVPGKMSVCNCLEGAAGLDDTLFVEKVGDTEEREVFHFPVAWMGWTGAARVQAIDEGIGVALSFRLSDVDNRAEMLDEVLGDLRVDGFRPLLFNMRVWDEEEQEATETDRTFTDDDNDKYDHQDEMQEQLFSGYEDGTLARAMALWVSVEAFDQIKAGEEVPGGQGVLVFFSRGTFSAIFVPDVRMILP